MYILLCTYGRLCCTSLRGDRHNIVIGNCWPHVWGISTRLHKKFRDSVCVLCIVQEECIHSVFTVVCQWYWWSDDWSTVYTNYNYCIVTQSQEYQEYHSPTHSTHTSRALRACPQVFRAKTTVGRPVGPVSPSADGPEAYNPWVDTRDGVDLTHSHGLSGGTVYIPCIQIHTTVHSPLFLHPTMSTQSLCLYSILCTWLYSRCTPYWYCTHNGNAPATKG